MKSESIRKGAGWRECVKCGKWFYAKPSRPDIKYCSMACRRNRVELQCVVCNKPFVCVASIAPKRRTCSDQCSFIYQSKIMRGHQFKEIVGKSGHMSRTQSQLENVCVICGYNRAQCDCCHIIPSRESNCYELWNMVRMCPNHHRLFDNGKLDDHPVVIEARREAWKQFSVLNAE